MLNSLFRDRFKGRKRTKRGDEKMTVEKFSRPTVVSVTSVIISLVGFALTVASVIVGVELIYRPHPSTSVIATLLSLVLAPLLTLSGYNLWKMKKWAAQLAATILLIDLISAAFMPSSSLFLAIFVGIAEIIILVFIALSWEHLRYLQVG
jgi:hypothetical protein